MNTSSSSNPSNSSSFPFKPVTPKLLPAKISFTPQTPKLLAKKSERAESSNSTTDTFSSKPTPNLKKFTFSPLTPKAKALQPERDKTSQFASVAAKALSRLRPERPKFQTAQPQPLGQWKQWRENSPEFCSRQTTPLKVTLAQALEYRQETSTGIALSDVLGTGENRDLSLEAERIRLAQPVGLWKSLDLEPRQVTSVEYEQIKKIYENNQMVLLNQLDRELISVRNGARLLQMLEEWMVCFIVMGANGKYERLVADGMSVHCDDDAREYVGEFDQRVQEYLDLVYHKRWGKSRTKGKHYGLDRGRFKRGPRSE